MGSGKTFKPVQDDALIVNTQLTNFVFHDFPGHFVTPVEIDTCGQQLLPVQHVIQHL